MEDRFPRQYIAQPLQLQAGGPGNYVRHLPMPRVSEYTSTAREKDKFETYLGALQAVYRHNKATSFALGLSAFLLSNELVTYDISGEYWLNQAGTSGSENQDGIGGELGVGKYMEHSRNRLKTSVIQASFKGTTKYRANNFSYGVVYQRENFRDRTKEWEWRDSAGYSLPNLDDGVHLVYNLSSRQDVAINAGFPPISKIRALPEQFQGVYDTQCRFEIFL